MTKRIITYVVLTAILTAIGAILSFIFFGEKTKEIIPSAQMRQSAKPEPLDTSVKLNPSEQSQSGQVRVLSISGEVEHLLHTGEQWNKLTVGEVLDAQGEVKTKENSKVVFRVGEKSRMELFEGGDLTVGDTTSENQNFMLKSGRMYVQYGQEGRSLRIQNKDGSAAAETKEGIFSILSTGTTVAVATKTGSVNLFAGKNMVTVKSGEQSSASDGKVLKPVPIPVDVILKVVDPECRAQRGKHVVIKGKTTPGSIIAANGVLAQVEVSGDFSVSVPLKQGDNKIAVVSEDALGRRAEMTFPCIAVDPKASIEKVDIIWGPVTH